MSFQITTNLSGREPLGIFDSGVGGLFVLREIQKYLPNENFVYFADASNAPYGEKTPDQILNFSLNAARFLQSFRIKGLIVACNTASCYGVSSLKKDFSLPIFDVIDPTIAFFQGQRKITKVLLLATNATVRSRLFETRLQEIAPWISLISLGCPEFVKIIEEFRTTPGDLYRIVEETLTPFLHQSFDAIILGCTHFLCLEEILSSFFPKTAIIVPSAKLLGDTIQKNLPLFPPSNPSVKFYTSGDVEKFKNSLMKHLHYTGPDVFSMSHKEIFC